MGRVLVASAECISSMVRFLIFSILELLRLFTAFSLRRVSEQEGSSLG